MTILTITDTGIAFEGNGIYEPTISDYLTDDQGAWVGFDRNGTTNTKRLLTGQTEINGSVINSIEDFDTIFTPILK